MLDMEHINSKFNLSAFSYPRIPVKSSGTNRASQSGIKQLICPNFLIKLNCIYWIRHFLQMKC